MPKYIGPYTMMKAHNAATWSLGDDVVHMAIFDL